jgi:hypothetical protein
MAGSVLAKRQIDVYGQCHVIPQRRVVYLTVMASGRESGERSSILTRSRANVLALRGALLVAALFAILFQSFIVQAHAHARHDMAPIAHSVETHAKAGTADGSTQPDESDCPICWEMAHSGVFVLPGDPVFLAPETSAIWVAALLPSASVRNGRSHAWRSRAPPLPLQA